jgi:hypothetical protein
VVDKLQFAYTGPWRITALLKGASYELEHCQKPGRKEKKHASDLSPYPLELIPFQPVDGADTRYGQLYKPITAHPFKEAGIKGILPDTTLSGRDELGYYRPLSGVPLALSLGAERGRRAISLGKRG